MGIGLFIGFLFLLLPAIMPCDDHDKDGRSLYRIFLASIIFSPIVYISFFGIDCSFRWLMVFTILSIIIINIRASNYFWKKEE